MQAMHAGMPVCIACMHVVKHACMHACRQCIHADMQAGRQVDRHACGNSGMQAGKHAVECYVPEILKLFIEQHFVVSSNSR